MVDDITQVGQVVSSRAGRDKDRFFVVCKVENSIAAVADGKLRKVEKPKRKNLKHLITHPEILVDIARKISEGEKITNSEIRRALANLEMMKNSEL